MMDFSTATNSSGTIIIGGGIIGLSTAYYLALAEKKAGAEITIIDRAPELFLGASGKGNGVLGDYGFADSTAQLGSLSWSLHKKLTENFDGRERWGFSDIIVHRPCKAPNDGSVQDNPTSRPLPPWFQHEVKIFDRLDGDPALAARLVPKQFCQFLKEECENLGVEIILNTQVTRVNFKSNGLDSVDVERENYPDTNSRRIPCQNLVIAAGPWSQRVFRSLFPDSPVTIPFDQDSKSGNYIKLRISDYVNLRGSCDQLYLQGVVGKRIDLSDYLDSEIYVGGHLSRTQVLPEKVTDVLAQPESINEMMEITNTVLAVSPGAQVERVAEGRAYRPVLTCKRPIITKVAFEDLANRTLTQSETMGGVFLNVGHGSDGITLGPGSGLVMSQLIQGAPPSVNIARLGLLPHETGAPMSLIERLKSALEYYRNVFFS